LPSIDRRTFVKTVTAAGAGFAVSSRDRIRASAPKPEFQYEPGYSGPASFGHGDIVTIRGHRFGTKPTAAPLVWDDASGPADVRDLWTTAWPDLSSPEYNTARRDAFRGVAPPHNLVGRYIAGCHYLEDASQSHARKGPNVYVAKSWRHPGQPVYLFASCYMRFDPAWNFGGDNNYKLFKWCRQLRGNNVRLGAEGHSWVIPARACTSLDDTRFRLAVYTIGAVDGGYVWGRANRNRANPMAGWVKYELENRFHPTDPDTGFMRLYENGRLILDYHGVVEPTPGPYLGFCFGHFARPYWGRTQWRYLTDCYLDTSLARIVLGNGPTFGRSTLREMQLLTEWSPASVTFRCWQGAHATLSGVSLYVVRPDNTRLRIGAFL
jgi:hypothetical protein